MTTNAGGNQQKTTDFVPSAEQLVFADHYIQSYGSIRGAFEQMGQNRAIYYDNWRHQAGFQEWLQDYAKSVVVGRVGKWYLLLEKFAEKGSFSHLDRLLQIAKEFIPENKLILDAEIGLDWSKYQKHFDALMGKLVDSY